MPHPRARRGAVHPLALLMVLVAFTVLLWFTVQRAAPRTEASLAQETTLLVKQVNPKLWVNVEGRDVELQGRADTADEVERAYRALREHRGVRRVKESPPRALVRPTRRVPDVAVLAARPDPDRLWDWREWVEEAETPEPETHEARPTPRKARARRRAVRRRVAAVTPHLAMPTLQFAPGALTLSPQSRRQLNPVAARLRAHPAAHVAIRVTGGGDGQDAVRARAVHGALVARGVPARRVTTLPGRGLSASSTDPRPHSAVATLTVSWSAP